jgi:hypothetical protein
VDEEKRLCDLENCAWYVPVSHCCALVTIAMELRDGNKI